MDCINVFLDPQCIVSHEDFQRKILKYNPPTSLVATFKKGRKNVSNYENYLSIQKQRLEVLHKKYLFWKFWNIFTTVPVVVSCFNKITKTVTVLKQDSTAVASLRIF